MFTTAKEAHVYIDGAIQNIASNRKQSIPPQFIDMVLNNAGVEYISSKFPERSNGKDIDSTLKRYTDFSVLHRTKSITPILETTFNRVARVIKPTDSLRIYGNLALEYIKPYVDELDGNWTYGASWFSIKVCIDPTKIKTDANPKIAFTYIDVDRNTINVSLDLSSAVSRIADSKGIFYVINYVLDKLRNDLNLEASFKSVDIDGNYVIMIRCPFKAVITETTSTDAVILSAEDPEFNYPQTIEGDIVRFAPISILSPSEIRLALSDYYGSKNLHENPIAEITEDYIDIYYTDFLPCKVYVDYIKKPRLFDIATGQIPEFPITKDFLDYAVKEFLLILNDDNEFDRVNAQTVKNL
jgi:hypothetical protein